MRHFFTTLNFLWLIVLKYKGFWHLNCSCILYYLVRCGKVMVVDTSVNIFAFWTLNAQSHQNCYSSWLPCCFRTTFSCITKALQCSWWPHSLDDYLHGDVWLFSGLHDQCVRISAAFSYIKLNTLHIRNI